MPSDKQTKKREKIVNNTEIVKITLELLVTGSSKIQNPKSKNENTKPRSLLYLIPVSFWTVFSRMMGVLLFPCPLLCLPVWANKTRQIHGKREGDGTNGKIKWRKKAREKKEDDVKRKKEGRWSTNKITRKRQSGLFSRGLFFNSNPLLKLHGSTHATQPYILRWKRKAHGRTTTPTTTGSYFSGYRRFFDPVSRNERNSSTPANSAPAPGSYLTFIGSVSESNAS